MNAYTYIHTTACTCLCTTFLVTPRVLINCLLDGRGEKFAQCGVMKCELRVPGTDLLDQVLKIRIVEYLV